MSMSQVIELVKGSRTVRLTDSALSARGDSSSKSKGPASVASVASSLCECQTAKEGATAYALRFPDKTSWELA